MVLLHLLRAYSVRISDKSPELSLYRPKATTSLLSLGDTRYSRLKSILSTNKSPLKKILISPLYSLFRPKERFYLCP